jgi:hypothetical protein
LDMLALYHNIPLFETTSNHGGGLGSLRSEGAQQRRSAIVDQDLREKLSDTANYVNVQAAAQNQGLQRRHDFQERALTSGEEELRLNSEAVRREAERRRGVEEKWSRVQEVRRGRIKRPKKKQDKRRSTSLQGVAERAYQRATAWHRGEGVCVTRSTSKQLGALKDTNESLTTNMTRTPRTPDPKMTKTGEATGEEEANSSENVRRLRDGNIHSADYNRRERNHSENRKDCNTSGERDFQEQNRPSLS